MTTFSEHFGKASVFAAVVENGSFSAASRALGLARSTVSESVLNLEKAFGMRLIERTTRKLRLTEEGELLYEELKDALLSWERVTQVLESRSTKPLGVLRVASPTILASFIVAPVLASLFKEHTELQAELIIGDKVTHLLEERIDVALRLAPMVSSGLIARKLCESPLVLVAAPGTAPAESSTVEELLSLSWVGHSHALRETLQLTHKESGEQYQLPIRIRARSTTTEGVLALLEKGAGIASLPLLLATPALASGRLVRVLPSLEGERLPFYAVYPSRPYVSMRLRVFLNALIEHVKQLDLEQSTS